MAFSEAAIMFVWRWLKIKISARHLIVFAAATAGTRWIIMAFAPPLWLLFPLQLAHCVTYAVAYFGGMQFIANWTSEDIAAEAQGFAFVLQQGMSIVALVGFGWLVALYGPGAWFGAAAFAFTGVALCLVSLRLQPVHAAAHR